VAWRFVLTTCLAWSFARGQSTTGLPPELVWLRQIEHEEFEPAVGKQIRHAYDQLRNQPQSTEAAGKLGMILQCYGKYELAKACYRRALGLKPDAFRWAYYLGNVEAWIGKTRDAIGDIQRALKIDETYTPARVRLAELLFETGDMDQSRQAFEAALRRDARLASAYFGLGRVLGARGDWLQAVESFRRACDLAPRYAAAHYALAMAYKKLGDPAKMREHLEIYGRVKESPQPAEDPLMNEVKSLYMGGLSQFAKASGLMREGKTKEAIAEFESAVRVNPRMVMAHVDLIALYGKLGQIQQAEEHYRSATALDPGWGEAYYNWGLILLRQHQTDDAITAFSEALRVNPYYADAHIQLGALLDETARSKDAQRHFRLALDDNPASREARFLLGRSLIRTGEFNEAIAQLSKTIDVDDEKTAVCMQTLAVAHQRAGNLNPALHFLELARDRARARKMDQLAAQLQEQLDQVSKEALAR